MISTVAYVPSSFPLPSETFIADEILSLYGQHVAPCILHLNDGNRLKEKRFSFLNFESP
jgi:hypothetical protein